MIAQIILQGFFAFLISPFVYFLLYGAFTKLEYFYVPISQPCPSKKTKLFPIKLVFLRVGGLDIKIQFCASFSKK